eukprot:jgi/Botrbrau1/20360/Bobra.0006s0025.1
MSAIGYCFRIAIIVELFRLVVGDLLHLIYNLRMGFKRYWFNECRGHDGETLAIGLFLSCRLENG